MKKSILLMAGLVGLALTSCKEDNPLGTMQKNEAPIIVPADGVALQSLYNATGNKVVLQDFVQSVTVPLIDIELSTDFPASSTVTGQVEIASNPDFTNAQVLSLNSIAATNTNAELAKAAGGDTRSLKGVVATSQWEDAFVALYGYDPNPKVNYVRYKLWLSNEKQNVILYNNNGEEWFDPMEFTVTPFDQGYDVAPAYTLYYTDGTTTQELAMYHNPENHEYDDPVFNAMVEVTMNADESANPITWWIAPSDNTERTYGIVEGDEVGAMTGDLAELSKGGVKGQIETPGTYKIEVNMLELTYTVTIAPQSLYVMYLGGQFANVAQLATSDYVYYDGMAGLLGKWALAGQANYKPTLYVNDPKVTTTTDEKTGLVSGGLAYTTDGASAMSANAIEYGKAGLYYITADLQALTYTLYPCGTALGIVGDMTNWGNKNDDGSVTADILMKGSRTTMYLEQQATLELVAGQGWKIRANNEWTVDFGGVSDGPVPTDGTAFELSKGGNNLSVETSGKYTVTVYLKRQMGADGVMSPYYLTITPAN